MFARLGLGSVRQNDLDARRGTSHRITYSRAARGAMVNNLIFNSGRFAVHFDLWQKQWEGRAWQTGRLSLVGNQMRHGPSTEPDTAFFAQRAAGHLEFYLADNLATDRDGRPVPAMRDSDGGRSARPTLAQADLPEGLCASGLRRTCWMN